MPLSIGTRLGPYVIEAPLGAGGMGEVYRAKDARLERDVAIKVLPTAFSADPDRLRRFEQESRAAAALNHPNLLAVYDIGTHDGAPYIVSELLEGETLRGRVARGSGRDTPGKSGRPAGEPAGTRTGLAVRKAIDYGVQIARGLAAAHDKGIVHRDLKPENVFVTTDGHVKILDFGLAKLTHGESAPVDLAPAATRLADTQPGLLLGTMGYMAPEQARGQTVDHRADIFAFGAILYEMLSGQRAFDGPTVADTISAILDKDPPELPLADRHIPPGLGRIVDRCLEKDPAARFQSTRDLAFALEALDTRSGADTPSPLVPGPGSKVPSASRHNERIVWTAALVLVTTTAVILAVRALRPVLPPAQIRLDITTPPTSDLVSLAISADGQKIVFAANADGQSRLWLRSLDSATGQPMNGTDGAAYPFWSPDNRSVGFFADGRLKRIDIDGGAVQDLAIAGAGRGGAWNRDGVILFAPTAGGGGAPLFRTSATSGEPAPVTRLAPKQQSHRFPQFLPDGRHFIYYVQGGPETRGVYLGQLDGSDGRRLVSADAAAVCASSWRLLFVQQGTLYAQDLDPDRLGLTGTKSPVAEHVFVDGLVNVAALSASAAGPIVFRAGAGAQRQLVWFDRSGKELDKVGDPDSDSPLNPSMSLDGQFVALQRALEGNVDIWRLELRTGIRTRFTTDEASENTPIWSPDGNRIVFQSNRKSAYDLYQKPATGVGPEELLLESSQNKSSTDWSRDGRFLLYRSLDPQMNYDIWALPLDGDRHPFPVVQTKFDERDGQFSPDGKWIAYRSNESGRVEIYIQAFPGPGARPRVSMTGGAQVRWGRDGKELFYIALDGWLMAVPIRFGSTGHTVEADEPVRLFKTRVGGAVQGVNRQQYMVSPDGQWFLMNTLTDEALASPITVVLNWQPKS